MKFKFDLLPQEYKSLPRDVFGILLAATAIVLCISWIGSMSVRNAFQLKSAQEEIEKAENELRDLNKRTGDLQPPMTSISSIKNRIDFLNTNLDTPASSWVDFVFTLEDTVPERVFIRDFNPKDLASSKGGQFTIDGDAASINDVLDFINRLQASGRFSQVFPVQNTSKVVEGRVLTAFTLSLTYQGKR